jgi:manganese-dependent inorganic pyrophosphatase
MQKSKLSLLVVIALAACVVVGIVAYNIGTNSTMKSISESIAKDDEVGIAINRSDLEKPSLVDGSIYVTGHKSPDADTVCSSIAYARLLNALGYDAQPVVAGRINNKTAYILDQLHRALKRCGGRGI